MVTVLMCASKKDRVDIWFPSLPLWAAETQSTEEASPRWKRERTA